MDILLALIGFSITMVVLSTLVAAVVEAIHEVRGLRQRHLTYLLGAMFDGYLWPKFKDLLPPTQDAAAPSETCVARTRKSGMELPPAAMMIFRSRSSGRLRGYLWWATTAAAVVAVLLGWILVAAAILVGVGIWYDRRKAPELFDFPGSAHKDRKTAALLDQISRYKALAARDKGAAQPPLTPAEQKSMDVLLQNLSSGVDAKLDATGAIRDAATKAAYERLERRRKFVDTVARVSSSVAATSDAADSSFAKRLNVVEFMGQLARSDFGMAVAEVAEDKLDPVLKEIGRRFDEFGRETAEMFQSRSRNWSVIAAMVVALVANVDAIQLMETYYRQPQIAERLDQAYGAELQRFVDRGQASASSETGQPEAAAGATPSLNEVMGRAQGAIDAIAKQADELAELGAPIGWSRFPFCIVEDPSELEDQCEEALETAKALDPKLLIEGTGLRFDEHLAAARLRAQQMDSPVWRWLATRFGAPVAAVETWIDSRPTDDLASWFFGVILAGLLIGLGGPFWFKVYQRLSGLASVARSLGAVASQAAGGQAQPGAPSPQPNEKHQPQDILDAFMNVLAAEKAIRETLAEKNAQPRPDPNAAPGTE